MSPQHRRTTIFLKYFIMKPLTVIVVFWNLPFCLSLAGASSLPINLFNTSWNHTTYSVLWDKLVMLCPGNFGFKLIKLSKDKSLLSILKGDEEESAASEVPTSEVGRSKSRLFLRFLWSGEESAASEVPTSEVGRSLLSILKGDEEESAASEVPTSEVGRSKSRLFLRFLWSGEESAASEVRWYKFNPLLKKKNY